MSGWETDGVIQLRRYNVVWRAKVRSKGRRPRS